MRILVTGGTGFTGSHLTRRLLGKGHQVVVIDNQPGHFLDELKAGGAEVFIGSVSDRDLVDKATQGCEIVYHVAAMFRKVNLPKMAYRSVNVEGTRNIFEAALKFGIKKVVNCSTCGVHGNVKGPPATEESPIAPKDYYQFTKYEGEELAAEYAGKGLKVVTVRPTAIYGPGDPERFFMLFKMVSRGEFLMFGNGEAHYHPVYIDNLIDGFELAAASDKVGAEAYLIGDEHHYSLNDLIRAIADTLGVDLRIRYFPFWPLWTAAALCELAYKPLPIEPPLFRRRADWFQQNRAFSIEKARKELGYSPKVSLKEGLAWTAAWYREKGLL